jgi:outer membrane protein assembly factor BamB
MHEAPVLGTMQNVLATNGGRLISFDLAGRKVGWTRQANFIGQVSSCNGNVYARNDGQVDIRREGDGGVVGVWAPPAGEAVQSNIVVTKNLLFASTEARTYAVDLATGQTVWSIPRAGKLSLGNDGTLAIAGATGTVTAVDLRYRRR